MIDAEPIPEPTSRLAPAARAYWTAEAVPGAVVLVVLALVARTVVADAADGFPRWALDALVVVAVLAAVVGVAIVPQLRWRRWRWAVRDEEVDLLHGRLALRRTLVPIARIQHVQTERTAVGRLFGVATVRFYTAAGTTAIPALPEAQAASIRDRVARQARVPDEL